MCIRKVNKVRKGIVLLKSDTKLDIYFKSQKLSVFFFIYRVVFLYILSIA